LESEFSRLRSDLDEAAESGVRLAYEKSALLAEISAIEDSRDKLAEIQSEYDALARERDALKTQRERTVKKLTELAKFVESIGDA
jgi:predicted nuclease with TOPRIM domain